MALAETGNLLEPVLPGAGEPVHEHQRRALSHLDVVDLGSDHLDLVAMLGPVDAEPLRIGVAVGVGSIRRGGLRELGPPRGQPHGEAGVGGDPPQLLPDRALALVPSRLLLDGHA
jgi:hypothetical protein